MVVMTGDVYINERIKKMHMIKDDKERDAEYKRIERLEGEIRKWRNEANQSLNYSTVDEDVIDKKAEEIRNASNRVRFATGKNDYELNQAWIERKNRLALEKQKEVVPPIVQPMVMMPSTIQPISQSVVTPPIVIPSQTIDESLRALNKRADELNEIIGDNSLQAEYLLSSEKESKLAEIMDKLAPMWDRIQRRKDQNSNLTLKEYQNLTGKDYPAHVIKDQFGREYVSWDNAIDNIATDYGFETPEDLYNELEKLMKNREDAESYRQLSLMAESDLDKVEGQLRVLKNKGESNETTTSETAGGTITPGNTEAQRINRQDINEPTVNRAGTGGVEKVVSVKQPVVKSKPIIKKESPKIDSLVMSKAITAQIVKDVSQQASEAIYKELMRKVTALLRNEYAKMVREGKFIRNPRPASIRSMEIKAKAQREVNGGRDFIPLKKVVVPKKVIKKKLIRQKPAVLTIVRKRNTEWDWVPKGSW